jgi:hypothetical protein
MITTTTTTTTTIVSSHGDNNNNNNTIDKDTTSIITLDKYFSLFPNIGTGGRLYREIHEMMGFIATAIVIIAPTVAITVGCKRMDEWIQYRAVIVTLITHYRLLYYY